MFKRIRKGLFGRSETEEQTSEAQPISPEETASQESAPEPSPDGGGIAGAERTGALDRQETPLPLAPSSPVIGSAARQQDFARSAPTSPAVPTTSVAAPGSPTSSASAAPPVSPAAPPPITPQPSEAASRPAAVAQPASATVVPQSAEPAPEWDEEEEEGEADYALDEQTRGRRGFFRNPFTTSLGRTRQFFGRMNAVLEEADEITDELWDELEETLITGDVGVQTTERLLAVLRERVTAEQLTRGSQLRDALKEELEILLGEPEDLIFSETSPITVILVVGVNGVGKTTSIAKLANLYNRQKHRVMLVAGDTFRAAATEQLKTWGERISVPVISQHHGADPAAVVYDGMQAAQARGSDLLIVDTAGRLHTKYNLMEELKKIVRVLQKYDPEAPHDILLVIDATTGQNGFLQAKQFVQDTGVSGVILTKLDGTARGGIAFAVASELGLPIKFVGTGEHVKDIAPFDAHEFVEALFE